MALNKHISKTNPTNSLHTKDDIKANTKSESRQKTTINSTKNTQSRNVSRETIVLNKKKRSKIAPKRPKTIKICTKNEIKNTKRLNLVHRIRCGQS